MCGGLILLDRSKARSGAACRNFCLAYYYAVYIGMFSFLLILIIVEWNILYLPIKDIRPQACEFLVSLLTGSSLIVTRHSILTLYLPSDLQYDAIDKSVSTSLHDVSNLCGEE